MLYYLHEKQSVRVYFPSELLREATDFLQLHLIASFFNVYCLEQPVNRDVEHDEAKISMLQSMLVTNRRPNTCVVVAPEHFLSMKLKVIELQKRDAKLAEQLHRFLDVPHVDVF